MSSLIQVRVHPSQFPEQIRQDLLASLHARQVKHKFLYDSMRQTQKWLALHEACSPAQTDPDCAAIYDTSFMTAANRMTSPRVTVISLGCGGGRKDAQLLRRLAASSRAVTYVPCDVSTAMVLVAQQSNAPMTSGCWPMVFDLERADDLPDAFDEVVPHDSTRLFTFFGMIPNFEPRTIVPRLASLVDPEDSLLISANLAPGPDYAAGVQRILPQYDNTLTREWLRAFLSDLGVERAQGEIHFAIEACPQGTGAKSIVAHFVFSATCVLAVHGERFEFRAGDRIRLFYSYRYTPEMLRQLLSEHRISVLNEWVTSSGEEGVFLCAKAA
jgi:uncharacterized SAM-dependent methyltransferase